MQKCWHKDAKARPSMSDVVKHLDKIIFDVTVQDHSARKMWRDTLQGGNFVKWDEFAKCLSEEIKFKYSGPFDKLASLPIELRCLHELIVPKKKSKKENQKTRRWRNCKSQAFWRTPPILWSA